MKTIKKTIALSVAALTTSFAFGQLGLGVTSATQAAVNATVNTTAVLQTTIAATAATKSTLNVATMKTADIKATTGATVKATGRQAAGISNEVRQEVKNSTDARAGIGVNVSSNTNGNLQSGNTSVQTGANHSTAAGADVQVNGSQVIDKTESVSAGILTTAENKTNAAVNTTKEVKANTSAALNADAQAAKEAAASVKPQANANVAADAKATVTKQ